LWRLSPLLDWLFFGKDGIITENDPEEQEKRVKYLDLVASASNSIIKCRGTPHEPEGPCHSKSLPHQTPQAVRGLRGGFAEHSTAIEGAIPLPIEIAET